MEDAVEEGEAEEELEARQPDALHLLPREEVREEALQPGRHHVRLELLPAAIRHRCSSEVVTRSERPEDEAGLGCGEGLEGLEVGGGDEGGDAELHHVQDVPVEEAAQDEVVGPFLGVLPEEEQARIVSGHQLSLAPVSHEAALLAAKLLDPRGVLEGEEGIAALEHDAVRLLDLQGHFPSQGWKKDRKERRQSTWKTSLRAVVTVSEVWPPLTKRASFVFSTTFGARPSSARFPRRVFGFRASSDVALLPILLCSLRMSACNGDESRLRVLMTAKVVDRVQPARISSRRACAESDTVYLPFETSCPSFSSRPVPSAV